jgi:hypothetical protein
MKFMVPLDEKFVVCFAGQLDYYACFFPQSEGWTKSGYPVWLCKIVHFSTPK